MLSCRCGPAGVQPGGPCAWGAPAPVPARWPGPGRPPAWGPLQVRCSLWHAAPSCNAPWAELAADQMLLADLWCWPQLAACHVPPACRRMHGKTAKRQACSPLFYPSHAGRQSTCSPRPASCGAWPGGRGGGKTPQARDLTADLRHRSSLASLPRSGTGVYSAVLVPPPSLQLHGHAGLVYKPASAPRNQKRSACLQLMAPVCKQSHPQSCNPASCLTTRQQRRQSRGGGEPRRQRLQRDLP